MSINRSLYFIIFLLDIWYCLAKFYVKHVLWIGLSMNINYYTFMRQISKDEGDLTGVTAIYLRLLWKEIMKKI